MRAARFATRRRRPGGLDAPRRPSAGLRYVRLPARPAASAPVPPPRRRRAAARRPPVLQRLRRLLRRRPNVRDRQRRGPRRPAHAAAVEQRDREPGGGVRRDRERRGLHVGAPTAAEQADAVVERPGGGPPGRGLLPPGLRRPRLLDAHAGAGPAPVRYDTSPRLGFTAWQVAWACRVAESSAFVRAAAGEPSG